MTAQADSRVYDGTTGSAVAPVLTGALYDAVGTAATQSFDTRHVGTGKTLTASGLIVADGNGGNNYAVTYVPNNTGVITAAPLTVTAVTDTRIYDGTTNSAGAPAIVAGALVGGDTASFLQSFDTRNAGTGKTLAPTGSITDGNAGANYAVTYIPVFTGSITARPITVTAVTDTKVYDGTAVSSGAPVIAGGVGLGDTAAFVQAFSNQNAGTGKTLTASGTVSDGNGGANYAVSLVPVATGSITPRPLTVTADDISRPIGQANPPFTATISGLAPTDTPAALGGGLSFATTATITSPVGPYPITPSGLSSPNYLVSYLDGVLAVTASPAGGSTIAPPASSSARNNLFGNFLFNLGCAGSATTTTRASGGIWPVVSLDSLECSSGR